MVLFKTLSGTIPANSNEITFTDSIINSNTIVEAYYNNNDVYTVETWQDDTTIGIVVNDHTVPVGIKVTLNNVNSFEPYDDTDLVNQINGLSDDVSGLDGRLDTAEDDIDSLETRMGGAEDDIDALESGKQNVLTAGNNITIEDNVISASGGSRDIDYSQIVANGGGNLLFKDDLVYTAVNDCVVYASWSGSAGTNMYPVINGVQLITMGALSNRFFSGTFFLKAGDVFSKRTDSGNNESAFFKYVVFNYT